MKNCPNCNSEIPDSHIVNSDHGHNFWVYCDKCWLSGPQTKTAAEAEAAWNAMPRRGDVPAASLTLEVEGHQFNISFSTNGPVTFCHIVYRDELLPAHPTFTLGSAFCHPNDPFDFATGEKLAMRDACKNLGHWFYISGRDPQNKREISHKLYSAYRAHLREQRGEWPFKQPEPATIDIAELIE